MTDHEFKSALILTRACAGLLIVTALCRIGEMKRVSAACPLRRGRAAAFCGRREPISCDKKSSLYLKRDAILHRPALRSNARNRASVVGSILCMMPASAFIDGSGGHTQLALDLACRRGNGVASNFLIVVLTEDLHHAVLQVLVSVTLTRLIADLIFGIFHPLSPKSTMIIIPSIAPDCEEIEIYQ